MTTIGSGACDCGTSPSWRPAAMLLWVAFLSGDSTYIWATAEAYLFVPLGLEIAALAASPGPRRGLQILTWKHGALVVIVTLAVATASYPVTLIAIAMIGTAMALASPLGRWLLAIAAWPLFTPPLVVTPWLFYLPHGVGVVGWAGLGLAGMSAVTATSSA